MSRPTTTARIDEHDDYVLYQTSTIAALLAGVYDGEITVQQLIDHGDFGLGTFNHLDGEMVVLDGICYHLRDDGSVTTAAGTEKTPYAAVMHFHGNRHFHVDQPSTMTSITSQIDRLTGSPNLPLGVRIDGTFSTLRTRTIGQQRKPYPPLVEAAARETVNSLDNTVGTIAGFRTPQFEEAIAVAGYHLHYVDDDRLHGGHVLDLVLTAGRVSTAPISELRLVLPDTPEYRDAHLDLAQLAQQEQQAEGAQQRPALSALPHTGSGARRRGTSGSPPGSAPPSC
jgi:acetolactate decarboxylase